MPLSEGSKLPDATLLTAGPQGPEQVSIADRLANRRVVIFALPGAFTRTCSVAHMPSFIRTKPGFDAKGVDEVICIATNDPFVMKAWGESTGADDAGITLLADPACEFTAAIGMEFDRPAAGLLRRSRRYAALVENGTVRLLQIEESPGTCELTAGEALLARMDQEIA